MPQPNHSPRAGDPPPARFFPSAPRRASSRHSCPARCAPSSAFTFAPLERRAVENRLVSVTANGQTTTFTYDGDGVRVKKVDASGTTYTPGEHYEVKGGVVTKYYYLGGQRVAMKVGSTV